MQEYINTYYVAGTEKVGIQIQINAMARFRIKVVVTMITMVVKLESMHLDSRIFMQVGVQCLIKKLFD